LGTGWFLGCGVVVMCGRRALRLDCRWQSIRFHCAKRAVLVRVRVRGLEWRRKFSTGPSRM